MEYLILILGVIAAAVGGELFVRGAVGLAAWIRIPAGIIGATVAAFATSSPELAVAVNASVAGEPHIALGDALGSNVVNTALILGLAITLAPMTVPRGSLRRDFPIALLAPLLTVLLVLDGEFGRIDALITLGFFIAWLVAVVLEVRRQRSLAEKILGETNRLRVVTSAIGGLFLLIIAGRLIISGAKSIASSFGMEEFTIGATVVAIGTSVPELATVIISRYRGHEEIGLGTVLGSNIFNNLWIISVAALVAPMTELPLPELSIGIGFGILAMALTFPTSGGKVGRLRGVMLLMAYLAYLVVILRS